LKYDFWIAFGFEKHKSLHFWKKAEKYGADCYDQNMQKLHLNHDNVFNELCPAEPSLKSKV